MASWATKSWSSPMWTSRSWNRPMIVSSSFPRRCVPDIRSIASMSLRRSTAGSWINWPALWPPSRKWARWTGSRTWTKTSSVWPSNRVSPISRSSVRSARTAAIRTTIWTRSVPAEKSWASCRSSSRLIPLPPSSRPRPITCILLTMARSMILIMRKMAVRLLCWDPVPTALAVRWNSTGAP